MAVSALVVATTLALSLSAMRVSANSALPNAGKDDALLASVLQSLKTDLASVAVGPPPSDSSATGDSAWLYVTHNAGETTAQQTEDTWYTYLIAGAYGAQCDAQGADCLSGYVFAASKGTDDGDRSGRLVMQDVTQSAATQAELTTTIEQRLADEGLKDPSISYLQPYGLAAIVQIATSDPQAAVDNLRAAIVFNGLGLDGYLVRIVDSSGDTKYIESASERSQAGIGWTAPELRLSMVP